MNWINAAKFKETNQEDYQLYVGSKIKLYGEETTVRGFYLTYNDAIGKWEPIILTDGRGDPFQRTLNNVEINVDEYIPITQALAAASQPASGLRWVRASERLPDENYCFGEAEFPEFPVRFQFEYRNILSIGYLEFGQIHQTWNKKTLPYDNVEWLEQYEIPPVDVEAMAEALFKKHFPNITSSLEFHLPEIILMIKEALKCRLQR